MFAENCTLKVTLIKQKVKIHGFLKLTIYGIYSLTKRVEKVSFLIGPWKPDQTMKKSLPDPHTALNRYII
jgi:hypothetical protein